MSLSSLIPTQVVCMACNLVTRAIICLSMSLNQPRAQMFPNILWNQGSSTLPKWLNLRCLIANNYCNECSLTSECQSIQLLWKKNQLQHTQFQNCSSLIPLRHLMYWPTSSQEYNANNNQLAHPTCSSYWTWHSINNYMSHTYLHIDMEI